MGDEVEVELELALHSLLVGEVVFHRSKFGGSIEIRGQYDEKVNVVWPCFGGCEAAIDNHGLDVATFPRLIEVFSQLGGQCAASIAALKTPKALFSFLQCAIVDAFGQYTVIEDWYHGTLVKGCRRELTMPPVDRATGGMSHHGSLFRLVSPAAASTTSAMSTAAAVATTPAATSSKATATATSTASTVATTTAAAWPSLTRLGFVDGQGPSAKLCAIHGVDCFFRTVRHLDEAEATRAAGLPVHNDLRFDHGAEWRESRLQVFVRGRERQVPDIQILAHRHPPRFPLGSRYETETWNGRSSRHEKMERGLGLVAANGRRSRSNGLFGNAGVEEHISESDFARRQDGRNDLGGENARLKAMHQDRITVSNAKAEVGNTFVIFP